MQVHTVQDMQGGPVRAFYWSGLYAVVSSWNISRTRQSDPTTWIALLPWSRNIQHTQQTSCPTGISVDAKAQELPAVTSSDVKERQTQAINDLLHLPQPMCGAGVQ